jgi:hypothetical protein
VSALSARRENNSEVAIRSPLTRKELDTAALALKPNAARTTAVAAAETGNSTIWNTVSAK